MHQPGSGQCEGLKLGKETMNTALEEKRLLTSREAAEVLRVHVETVRTWAKKGYIGRKLGGVWRFRQDELEAFTRRRNGERD